MWSASASERSRSMGATSRRIRPRLSSKRVRSVGSCGRSVASLVASIRAILRSGERPTRQRAGGGAASSVRAASSPRFAVLGRPRTGRSELAGAVRQARRAASPRDARSRARGCGAGFARPGRQPSGPGRRDARRVVSAPPSALPIPPRRTPPRPVSTTSGRAARRARSTARPGARSPKPATRRSARRE